MEPKFQKAFFAVFETVAKENGDSYFFSNRGNEGIRFFTIDSLEKNRIADGTTRWKPKIRRKFLFN
ncbi:hypothetical protein DLM78_04930 [Leptospira stimsonii]|uniref:Uncharacterized protein n=1 Tax=Leptospira stimsonii TaxID=2202203 RepID=A0A8B3CSS2_9LEPT|nr:hypothetical protein DLM78_04930 [Leptospira stimsonii]